MMLSASRCCGFDCEMLPRSEPAITGIDVMPRIQHPPPENWSVCSPVHFTRAEKGDEFCLSAVQFLPQPRQAVFEFFADAFQLEALTPPWLNFAVLTPRPIQMSPGLLIDYRLKLHGVPLRWQSRIEVWEPPVRFVDVQIRGPYRRWHHEHLFEEVDGGTLCYDTVHYAVPGGHLVDRFFVRPDLMKIFAYRQARLRELIPQWPAQ